MRKNRMPCLLQPFVFATNVIYEKLHNRYTNPGVVEKPHRLRNKLKFLAQILHCVSAASPAFEKPLHNWHNAGSATLRDAKSSDIIMFPFETRLVPYHFVLYSECCRECP